MCRGSGEVWIGLVKYSASSTDPSPSEQYWLDGSTSTFRRWGVDKPNKENARCIRINSIGLFIDKQCDHHHSILCKKTGGVYVVCYSAYKYFQRLPLISLSWVLFKFLGYILRSHRLRQTFTYRSISSFWCLTLCYTQYTQLYISLKVICNGFSQNWWKSSF